jgi:hypothetical protein
MAGLTARRPVRAGRPRHRFQASLKMAITIPISTNTTIAACSHIHVGDTPAG